MDEPYPIYILGQKYTVEAKPVADMDGNDGHVDFEAFTISIDDSLRDESYWITLVHEVCHAVVHESSINLVLSEVIEEILVDLIAKQVVKNFRIEKKAGTSLQSQRNDEY